MSDSITVNLGTGPGPGSLPEGAYRVIIDTLVLREARTGSRYIEWGVRVEEGIHAGRRLRIRASLLPTAAWKMAAILAAIHMPATGQVTLGTADVEGRRMVIDVATRGTYRGRVQMDAVRFRPIPNGEPGGDEGRSQRAPAHQDCAIRKETQGHANT